MSREAITEKEERVSEQARGGLPGPARESAPSVLREDEPTFPRTLGMFGAGLVIFGAMALAFNLAGRTPPVRTGGSIFCLALGLCGLLFHAAFDRDVQFRRLYMIFGFATLGLGVILSVMPFPEKVGDSFRYGVPCILLALLFMLAFLRNEDVPFYRDLAQRVLLLAGVGMAAFGLFGGMLRGDILLPVGLVLSLVGLLYLISFVGTKGISSDLAYYVALGISGVGALVILLSLGRSLFSSGGATYFTSYGLILLLVGLFYIATGAGMSLDWPVFVLTRRELGSFFYSPIAYLSMLGFAGVSWVSFLQFLELLTDADPRNPVIEPIVRNYLFAIFPVITICVIVPIMTMRLLSEEQRTGTMEVLLTAPVDELGIVMSKFMAALITYLFIWLPFGLYLLAIPLAGGSPFDYRPLLSFFVALVVTGAGFVSMGLFFSSLTRNQVASGVLTFAGMATLTYLYFAAHQSRDEKWQAVLSHLSYLHTWFSTLEGKIVPSALLFPLSMTILSCS